MGYTLPKKGLHVENSLEWHLMMISENPSREDEDHGTNNIDELRGLFQMRLYCKNGDVG